MKLLEKILGVIIVIALIMKFAFIVGSNVLIVMAISLLSVIYYPMGFAFFNGIRLREILKKASYKGLSTWRILGAIGAGMALGWAQADLNKLKSDYSCVSTGSETENVINQCVINAMRLDPNIDTSTWRIPFIVLGLIGLFSIAISLSS